MRDLQTGLTVSPRFYAPDLALERPLVSLPPDEAEHLTRVLRIKPGTVVVAFDGKGNEFLACVDTMGQRDVTIRLLERREPLPEPAVRLTLAQALLKSDKMDRVVRDAAMLGASTIQPLLSARTEIPPAALRNAARRGRWERTAIASIKQCGRAVVPVIREVADIRQVIAAAEGLLLMLVEPGSAAGIQAGGAEWLEHRPRPSAATILVGPEGGWAPDEVEAAAKVGVLLTLGRQTLRADAAGAAVLAVLQYIWRD